MVGESFTWKILVKLLSTKDDEKSIVQLEVGGMDKFILWNELLDPANDFVTNKSIKLEVLFIETPTLNFAKNFLQKMSSSTSVPIKHMRFTIEFPKISKLQVEGFYSPEVMIRGIPWKVQVCKCLNDDKQTVFVFLYCLKQDTSSKWSYAASFSTKLVPFSKNSEALERHYLPNVYDCFGYGDPLIEWNDLFDANKCYVKNDMITLDIEIDVADPNASNKSELIFAHINTDSENDRHKYYLTIINIRSLVAVKSPQFIVANTPWHLTIYRHRNQFGVRLDFKVNHARVKC
ncbi:uncharacterized protein LOC116347701 [Contarinia nasturtii]|uniref:uncharacterized protein LOC116347701 n=1 Tax=Contarinia nasturtii TaxID=265458 RepID=UPI0012D38F5A|nr:uncharacterized protein LOC116347701 [Contarinia nasturtii]XP_031634266.1 uncharacterized protein LOC116347701 [Contarinia nasturtii]XP_031634267.1 uncharacterized protein LOC116347701 [Contarinia nasturtii]